MLSCQENARNESPVAYRTVKNIKIIDKIAPLGDDVDWPLGY